MPSQKKPSVSSKSSHLCSIGEYDNEGMSDEDEVFSESINDLNVRNEPNRGSILRKKPVWGRAISVDQSSNKHVAFEDTQSSAIYENEVELESDDEQGSSAKSITNQYSERSTLEHDQDIQPIFLSLADDQDFSKGRFVYIKKMEDAIAEKIFFVDKEGQGLFPKFQLDQRTVNRNILNKRKPTIFQQVAKFHHKYGIRHFLLVLVLALYALGGGYIFLLIEAENEVEQLEINVKQLEQLTQNLSIAIFEITNVSTTNDTLKRSAVFLIHEFYERMLKVEGRYIGSAYHKYEMLDRLTWNYLSAVFYAMTLFTTIGYGSIACATVTGKVATVIYSIIGIPAMLVVLSDIGKVLLHWFTAAFNGARRSIRHIQLKFKRKLDKSKLSKIESGGDDESVKSWDSEIDDKPFPMYLTVPIIVFYLLFCSVIISVFDQSNDMYPGISFGNALYFSFISISTIGLGDVLPNNIEFNPLVALMFLFGLALLSVVNTTVFEILERKLMNSVNALEDYLETSYYYRHGRDGYETFKSLAPNIQLLALALPLFDDYAEQKIEHMLDPANTKRGKQLYPRRTRSMIADDINNFRPSLGILNVSTQPKRTRATTFTGCFQVHDPSKNPPKECFTIVESPINLRQMSRAQSERSTSLINPNFEAPRIRTLSERKSSSSEASAKYLDKY
ncbi:TWiK family of potassium channels protein 18 [Aphelenchoides bicaudatus]|nr:TWiK family of potassium channels protein 18 [Aphelenchoides bicaudatus]